MTIQPIREKFLDKNYLFALEFREGFLFGRVVRRRHCLWKPYAAITTDGTAVDIGPEDTQAEVRFRDPRNTNVDILYLEAETKAGYPWFLHGAIGMKPQYINGYLRYPEGKDIPGKFPSLDPIRPSSGDDLGYVNELTSPYDEPTDHIEIVISPGQHLGIEYYNKDALRSHQPVLNLNFMLYWVQFFGREHALMRRIALREVPAAFLTVGFGDTPVDLGDKLKKSWNVEPLSIEEAAR